jgi:hypothetical protein
MILWASKDIRRQVDGFFEYCDAAAVDAEYVKKIIPEA